MLGMGMGAWTCKPSTQEPKKKDCNHFKAIMAKQITRCVTTPAPTKRVSLMLALVSLDFMRPYLKNISMLVYIFK